MGKEHDKLAQRLADILTILNNGDSVTVVELSEKFGVSKRTIHRDLQKRFAFLPLIKEKDSYKLEPYVLGKFTQENIREFTIFSGIQGLYPSLDQKMFADILNKQVNRVLLVKGFSYEDISVHQTLFNQIATQIATHQKVRFLYKEKQRCVEPYKLLNTNGIWYLLAVENDILKTFTFTKIEAFELLNQQFIPDTDVINRIQNHQGQWFGQNEFEVILKIDILVAEYFLRRDIIPVQKIIEHSEESLTVSTMAAYDDEILRTIRYWMPHICIVSPQSLREKLLENISSYLSYAQKI